MRRSKGDAGGKVVIITGSSRGIGKAIAIELAKRGVHVCLTYKINKIMAQQVSEQIVSHGGKASIFTLDVCSRSSIEQCVNKVKKHIGHLDFLINNAGINLPNDFDKIDDSDWDLVINTNLSGAFKVSQLCFPLIKKGGSIVNISSVSGQYIMDPKN